MQNNGLKNPVVFEVEPFEFEGDEAWAGFETGPGDLEWEDEFGLQRRRLVGGGPRRLPVRPGGRAGRRLAGILPGRTPGRKPGRRPGRIPPRRPPLRFPGSLLAAIIRDQLGKEPVSQPPEPPPANGAPAAAGPGSTPSEPAAEPALAVQGSEHVRWVQSTLNQVLSLNLPEDGVMGVETRSALRSFQQKQGLPADGTVGPDTEKALLAARAGQASPGGNGGPAAGPDAAGSGDSSPPPEAPSGQEVWAGPAFEVLPFEYEEETEGCCPGEDFQGEWLGELAAGSKEHVRWVQASLNRILGLRLAEDGQMGPATRSAIRGFQQKQGLAADGIVGKMTEAALKAALASKAGGGAQPGSAPAPAPAKAAASMVDPAKVSCAKLDRKLPIFKAIGTTDPVGVLEAASQRAVVMLDSTIKEMTRIRERVRAGEPLAWPVLNDLLAWSLKNRMLMRVDDRAAWTGKGPRTAEQIIRWLSNIRKTIAGRHLWYTCLASTHCTPTTWAWVYPGRYRIYLCRSFWHAKSGIDARTHLEFQAQTLIHEVSHIYYVTEDSGKGPGHAECISQFVADANGSPIDKDFARFCGTPGPGQP